MVGYTLRQLEYFVRVADAGSIAAAAAELRLAESAVAAALGQLEAAVGHPLALRRRARGVTLTPAGEELLIRARTLLREAEELLAIGDDPMTGVVRLGCYTTLAPSIVPGLVERFEVAHPTVSVEVVDGDQGRMHELLRMGRIDLAILYDRDVADDLETVDLFRVPAHVLLPADHPLADAEAVSFAQLAGEPFIKFDAAPSWEHTMSLMAQQGVRPLVRHVTANVELARAMVGRGLGYCVLVNRPRTGLTHEGTRVVVKEITPPVAPVAVAIAWSRALPPGPRATALIELARNAVEVPPGAVPR